MMGDEARLKTFYMLAGAAVACALFVGVVFLQQTRDGWPSLSEMGRAEGAQDDAFPAAQTDHDHGRVPVAVDSAWVEHLRLQVEPARREFVARTVRASATVVPDEERVSHVHPRVSGWIETLYADKTGQTVRAGQPLAAIFSQDLYASQSEYLAIRARADSAPRSSVGEGARRRLQVLGMTDAEIAEIERSGEPRNIVTITAPREGVVLRRAVSAGTAVDPSTELMTIADLSQVWVLAEVPERDVPLMVEGASAWVDIPASGLEPFEAKISFLYPTLSERTRSLRARIVIDNAERKLRPGMTGTVQIQSAPRQALTVPRDAVVDTGDMQHVFVATSTHEFEPRPVRLGMRLPDRIEIIEGLEEGEPVLSSGVFLIDSESRLRGSGAAGMGHAGHGASDAGGASDKMRGGIKKSESGTATDDASHRGH